MFNLCQRLPHPADHRYGPGNQVLRFWRPRGRGPWPLLIYLPGGEWQTATLDGESTEAVARSFAEVGIAVAVVVTDQAPKVSLTEMVRQASQAVTWLWALFPELSLDSDRFFIAGHSSGAHIATIAAITDAWRPIKFLKGCIALSGIYDLAGSQAAFPQLRITDEEVQRLSPLRQSPSSMPPLLMAVGEDEGAFFRKQQRLMEARWKALGLPVEAVVLTAKKYNQHLEIPSALADKSHGLHRKVRAMCRGAVDG